MHRPLVTPTVSCWLRGGQALSRPHPALLFLSWLPWSWLSPRCAHTPAPAFSTNPHIYFGVCTRPAASSSILPSEALNQMGMPSAALSPPSWAETQPAQTCTQGTSKPLSTAEQGDLSWLSTILNSPIAPQARAWRGGPVVEGIRPCAPISGTKGPGSLPRALSNALGDGPANTQMLKHVILKNNSQSCCGARAKAK